MIKVKKLNDVKTSEFILLASLPDMGRVGGLVSSFLSHHLKTELVAEIVSSDKPWVSYAEGVVKRASDIYKISYDNSHKLMIFTGESQPQDPSALHNLCNTLLDYVQSIGKVTRLYAAGGYLRDHVTGAPRACGVVNRTELKEVLSKAGIELVGNEITTITWFNGLILGLAAERGIDAIGLFGEIAETNIPQPLAAKTIISAFSKLENIPIDTKPLDRQYDAILEDIKSKKNGLSKFGLGIG